MKRPPPHFPAILALALLVGSCIGTDSPTGVGEHQARLNLPIQPALIPSPADAGAAPINRIRARAVRVSNNQVLGETTVTVDPSAAEWTIVLTAQMPGGQPVDARVFVWLINATGGTESVQFSGMAGPLTLTPGQTANPADIDIVRGPIANLFVTGVGIDSAPDTLLEGATTPLTATATTTDTLPPQVYWTVIDSLSLTAAGSSVTGLLPGVARVIASAGAYADTASIVVRPAPATILLSPDTAFLVGAGEQASFSAVVADARGNTLTGEGVTWSSGAPTVVGSLGGGVFQALLPGSVTVRATSTTRPSVSGTAVVVVGAAPPASLDVGVAKTVDVPQPLEGTGVNFTVSVFNNGPDTATNVVVFDTLPAAPFLSPNHVVTTGTLAGDTLWTIPSLAPGDTARWTTSATIATGVAGNSATNRAVIRSLSRNDSTPANDTALVALNFPFSAVPVVQITAPADDAVFDPGDLVTFTATATDTEDGDLTSSIQWSSSVDGALGSGGSFETSQLTTGVHTISASATDSNTDTGADTITITIALITTPPTLNVPFAGTASLPITLSEPAQAGGITLAVTSANESITTPSQSSVFIAGGARSANATLSGLQPGVTTVTVSHPQFGASVTTVSVTAALNIVQTSLTVPETFPQPITVRLESQGSPTAAPAGGLGVTLASRNPACVSLPAGVTIAGGVVQASATVSAAAGASLPCSGWVVATAASMAPDSVNVNVTAAPQITISNGIQVGSGLVYGSYVVNLASGQHGGVTVRLQSDDPETLLVSPNTSVVGTSFIDEFVPAGQSFFYFVVHGVEGATGTPTLSASAPGFTTGNATTAVVTPAYQLSGLVSSATVFGTPDVFTVIVGVPNAAQTGMAINQAIRPGGTALTATVSSGNTTVAELITLTDSVSPVSAQITPGNVQTPTSVAAGGMAFFPLSAGTADVTASVPGLVALPGATQSVAVSTPGFTMYPQTVGSGLQVAGPYTVLGAAQHGGLSVTMASTNPSVFTVSPNASTPGTPSIDVPVANGQTIASFVIHGIDGQTGSGYVRMSAPGFTTDSVLINAVAPAFDVIGLNVSTTSFSPDDPFYVRLGIPVASGAFLTQTQARSAGASPLTVDIASGNTAVGDLLTLPDSASPVSVQILPGQANTPTSVAAGGVAFVPISAGTTGVTTTIGGFTPITGAGTIDVAVTAPAISSNNYWVGAGLQYGTLSANLGASDHPGVTVRVESLDPAVLLVSRDASTAGTAFIDIPVTTGQSSISYFIHGVEGQATDTIPLVFSAPGFVPDTSLITVGVPAFEISGLGTTHTAFSPNDDFVVRIGEPWPGAPYLRVVQPVRVGGPAVPVAVSVSNSGVGILRTSTSAAATVNLSIPAGSFSTPGSLALGGVTFDPLGIGTTQVSSSIAGFLATTAATVDVSVSAPGITVQSRTVGAGLQLGQLAAILGSNGHGGTTVTLTSSNPQVFLVSPNATTAGSASIQVDVPAGGSSATYYLQGVEGADAAATLTVTAPGFTNGVGTITVVPPAFDIVGLNSSQAVGAADDAFYVRTGYPTSNNQGLQEVQAPRAGSAGYTVTLTNSAPTIAQLVTTSTTGASVTVQIQPGQFNSPTTVAAGGVALDGLAPGTTIVSGSIPGVNPVATGSVTVTITP